jgi:peptidoglycan/xylan/chitin deacetylase (PgdA/CDA1 family)
VSVVVLMYHGLDPGLPTDPAVRVYTLDPRTFADQLDLLQADGRRVVSLAEAAEGRAPHGSVVLTFDDGWATDRSVALPQIVARGMTATFFLSPARIGLPGYLTWDAVRALAGAGMTIGTHGLDHTLLDGVGDAELERQLGESKRVLEERLGREVETASLPGGAGGRRALRAARRLGYRFVAGSRPGAIRKAVPALLPRVAIRAATTAPRFRALAGGRRRALLEEAGRHQATAFARAVLGRAAYERLKKIVLAVRPSSPS